MAFCKYIGLLGVVLQRNSLLSSANNEQTFGYVNVKLIYQGDVPLIFNNFTAEKFLESVECNQNYPVLLLHIVDKRDVEPHIRVSSAVIFKNYIKRNWRVVSFEWDGFSV